MPSEQPFDMPASGTWEQRGGWVVRRLAGDASLSLPQAAGLVGNLGYESRGFTALHEEKPLVAGSRGGGGIAQWTGSRRVNFERWCAEQGFSTLSDRGNYGFLLFELMGEYKNFAAALRRMTRIEDACHYTHQMYERPADVLDGSYRSGPDRLAWARRALAGATAITAPAGAPARDTPAATAPAAGQNPIELIRQAQRLLDTDDDGDPGPETRTKATAYRTAYPGA